MSEQVTSLVDHYFRNEYAKVVSYLTAKFGSQHLELAEDAVQEALFSAVKNWSYTQIPKNPSGWIATVASNKIIDHFRKTSRLDGEEAILHEPSESKELSLDSIQDDMVKMMFACCHPSLSTEYQIILTLKILGGLSVKEIARALLKKDEAVAKAYTRAKRKFQQEGIELILPPKAELKNRLNTVLHIIYLLFNEGYKATASNELVKRELCDEAIRLNGILLQSDECNVSMTNALMALMSFHCSRFDARVDVEGRLVTLEFQDRSKWDKQLIKNGLDYLKAATKGAFLNEFYVQAAISGLHCEAEHYADTKWEEILGLYDVLLRIKPSPVVQLNRVVALGKTKGAQEALKALGVLQHDAKMDLHYLYHAIKAEFLVEAGDIASAKLSLTKAIELTQNTSEMEHLKNKLKALS